MTLVVLSVIVVALLIAVLAVYLLLIGVLLNRVADNLDDCSKSVEQVSRQATVIGPGIKHLNNTGGKLVGAMPLLYGGAETLLAKLAPPAVAPARVGYMDASPAAAAPGQVGYMDAPATASSSAPTATAPAAAPGGVGHMDAPPASLAAASAGVGYMDA